MSLKCDYGPVVNSLQQKPINVLLRVVSFMGIWSYNSAVTTGHLGQWVGSGPDDGHIIGGPEWLASQG